MDSRQKFENFLESLKGEGQDTLIESVKEGFQACYEDNEPIEIKVSDDGGSVSAVKKEKKPEKEETWSAVGQSKKETGEPIEIKKD